MPPLDPLEGMEAPQPADPHLLRLADAAALLWQERQERIYAGRILQGIYYGTLENSPTLRLWAEATITAHEEVGE